MRRPQHMRAFAGFHVFPGGALHPEDSGQILLRRSTLSPDQAHEAMGEDAEDIPALAFYMCAIRELFEETGLLLAKGPGGELPSQVLERARRDLLAGRVTFDLLAEQLDLIIQADALRYQTRWVAPSVLPVRFDLRVFVGRAFGEPDPDPNEADELRWLSPQEAIGLAESGALSIAPPTIGTLNALMRFRGIDDLISGASGERSEPMVHLHSPLVRRLVAPNASVMTGPGTNTYVVGDDGLIVIDPGDMDRSHLSAIASLGRVETIVITHGHPDHFPGAFDLAEITGAKVAASEVLFAKMPSFGHGIALADGDRVSAAGVDLQVSATPGHSSDHICLWLQSERALFSGDLILGEGTTVIAPPDGSMSDYIASLRKVQQLHPARIYPGHFGPREDAEEWIDFYISHRLDREEQILAAVRSGATDPSAIVKVVYSTYPAHLHPVAERSVQAHLDKLLDDGRVVMRDGSFVPATHSGEASSPP